MDNTTQGGVLVPAALVPEITACLSGAIDTARNEAERIANAPASDGYSEDDVQDAERFVRDLERTYADFVALAASGN